jgi:hypothetical protein
VILKNTDTLMLFRILSGMSSSELDKLVDSYFKLERKGTVRRKKGGDGGDGGGDEGEEEMEEEEMKEEETETEEETEEEEEEEEGVADSMKKRKGLAGTCGSETEDFTKEMIAVSVPESKRSLYDLFFFPFNFMATGDDFDELFKEGRELSRQTEALLAKLDPSSKKDDEVSKPAGKKRRGRPPKAHNDDIPRSPPNRKQKKGPAMATSDPEGDPATCSKSCRCLNSLRCNSHFIKAFDIDCITKNAKSNRMKPFTISSDISLEDLNTIVASKMDAFTDNLELQYRLVISDKPSNSAMDVTTESELRILIKRLRVLSVPQLLSSGKRSSKTLIPPTVRFERAGEELEEQPKGTGGSKKVSSPLESNNNTKLHVKLAGRATRPEQSGPRPFGSVEDAMKTRYQNMLREKYLCESHTAKHGRDTFCYPEPRNPDVHHILAISDFGLWATRMVSRRFIITIFIPAKLLLD